MTRLSVKLLTFLLVAAACEAPTAPSTGDNLAEARALWAAKSSPDYSYKVNRACECVLGGRLMAVTVENGLVTVAEYVDSGARVEASLLTYVLTVPDLFDLIQDAVDRKVAYLSASYDPVYGYPTRIDIDYSANAVDDEVIMSARELTFR